MNPADRFVIVLSKCISLISTSFRLGAGATWPGEIALMFRPRILAVMARQIGKGIIVVAGTNGKTTTSLMITKILESQENTVVHNVSGANLLNGVVSALIRRSDWSGDLTADWGVFEVDENSLPLVLKFLYSSSGRSESRSTDKHTNVISSDSSRLRSAPAGATLRSNDKKIIVVLLNLFRDQLDRYGEVDVIVEKWKTVLTISRLRHDTGFERGNEGQVRFVVNADDPGVAYLGKKLSEFPDQNPISDRVSHAEPVSASDRIPKSPFVGNSGRTQQVRNDNSVLYFGVNDPKEFLPHGEHATDSIFCSRCGTRLAYKGIYYSHIGIWHCPKCGLRRPEPQITDFSSSLPGLYNRYNALAAAGAAKASGIPDDTIHTVLGSFSPAFGRQEEFALEGKKVKIFLSKNPAGFNVSVRTAMELGAKNIMLLLNDRIPDGRDVSWIWDVDFEALKGDEHVMIEHDEHMIITVSGDRVYDLAVRLQYADLPEETHELNVEEHMHAALRKAIDHTEKERTLYILATYSAMLEVRKLLSGRKIL